MKHDTIFVVREYCLSKKGLIIMTAKKTTTKETSKVVTKSEEKKLPIEKSTSEEIVTKEVPKELKDVIIEEKSQEEKPPKKVSAGKQIRDLFESIIPKLKDEHLEILTSQEKTKEVLKIRYSFLKEVKNEKDERKINGCPRYGKNTVKINDKEYYITNDLYKRNIEIFKAWVETIR